MHCTAAYNVLLRAITEDGLMFPCDVSLAKYLPQIRRTSTSDTGASFTKRSDSGSGLVLYQFIKAFGRPGGLLSQPIAKELPSDVHVDGQVSPCTPVATVVVSLMSQWKISLLGFPGGTGYLLHLAVYNSFGTVPTTITATAPTSPSMIHRGNHTRNHTP
eukprot:m.168668 g.168668  ORF g.168668 m.168668 type:complete len:160 (+) comp14756_c0_seq2:813-1292(+)